MNKRLEHIFRKIKTGKGVLDVGTDHGYIPVALALSGYSGKIFASDINQRPLDIAKKNAEKSSVSDRVSFILADGIPPECLGLVDTVVIAGMGGDMICHILDNAECFYNGDYTFILQPMSKSEILRYWLVNNGFSINEESLVLDNKRVYPVISARFLGENSVLSDAELYTGCSSMFTDCRFRAEMINSYIIKFERICISEKKTDGMYHSILNELKLMKKEI